MSKKLQGAFFLFLFLSFANFSCQKEVSEDLTQENNAAIANKAGVNGHLQQAKTFSSDVIIRWLNMQLDMFRLPLPAGTGTQSTDRAMAYSGIAAYEAVVNGMPAYQSLEHQLTDFPAMPKTEPGKAYHWAASANAALAEMSRRLFPTTAAANKTAMNNLESSLQASYAAEVNDATLQRSIAFGKEVATRIFAWAATDGSANVNPPYVPPVGVGLWVPTSPTPAVNPYAYQRRLLVPGSANGTALTPLPTFSTDPTSAYYAMVKEVYDISLTLTNEQKASADYFKDNPGYGAGGTYVAAFVQALNIAQFKLDMAALAYAKVGLGQHDATIVLFVNKYIFNVMRPITYIRSYINPVWNTYIPTPNHPEFPSGHATITGGALTMMSNVFGEKFPITLHTYDYLNYPPRSYSSFTQMGLDIANSRIYGGLHYRLTCERSIVQGTKVSQNILSTIKFLKE
ncbi:vanadium-dependent haloperoxidase [Lacibacter sp. H375]|uniref:vanadium-dependent haloperoxidase n=1 Tax=Lacibacter sp. H375 TaxID=3133424 RepID=UPI0030C0E61E